MNEPGLCCPHCNISLVHDLGDGIWGCLDLRRCGKRFWIEPSDSLRPDWWDLVESAAGPPEGKP